MKKRLFFWQLPLLAIIIFLIPANLAKHFIIPSSYVSGILIDYLIPTLYLTDILIFLLIIPQLGYLLSASFGSRFLIFPLFLLPSVISATSFLPAIYKWSQLFLLVMFSLWINHYLNLKKHFNLIVTTLSASVAFQSLLSLAQWWRQSSVFSYFFLGEQPYSPASTGIDKITWLNGSLKLPPLGTFPHPNVLAGFLAVTLPLIIYGWKKNTTLNKPTTLLYLSSLSLGLITLFLTFSLSAWLAFLLIGLPLTIIKIAKIRPLKFFFLYSGFFLILFSLALKFSFLAPKSSFSRRSQLAVIALKMTQAQPLTGIGLNNFTSRLEQYGFIPGSTRFLQPVHNIYLLIVSETGLIGLAGFSYLIFKSLVNKPGHYSTQLIRISFLTLLFIGLFDHYPLTLHQGSSLLFLLIGFLGL